MISNYGSYATTVTPGSYNMPLAGNAAMAQAAGEAFGYPAVALGTLMQTSNRGLVRGVGAGLSSTGAILGSGFANGIFSNADKIKNTGDFMRSGMSGVKGMFKGSAGTGLGLSIAGNVMSAVAGPKQEYSGEKGDITLGLDAVYDGISSAANFIPGVGTVVSGAMSLAKGTGALLNKWGGGTDAMTTGDAVLGSNFFSWNLGAVNGFTGKKAHSMGGKDFMTQRLLDNVWSGYQGSYSNYNNALTKEGKKYGGFSSGARKKANRIIDKANMDRENLLEINRLRELGDVRGNIMANIRGTAYEQALYGGFNSNNIRMGRLGLKLSDVQRVKRLNSAYRQITSFELGGKPKKKKLQEIQSDLAYYDPENNIVYYTNEESRIHENFHAKLKKHLDLLKHLESLSILNDLDDQKILDLGGDLEFVKRFEGDPGHFYSYPEVGARVHTAYEMTRKHAKDYTPEFFENARQNESLYGDNFRDLLHMFNNETLSKIFGYYKPRSIGGGGDTFTGEYYLDEDGEIGHGQLLKVAIDPYGRRVGVAPDGNSYYLDSYKEGGTMNVIPEGNLHARLHHMENADNLTRKGIPVVDNDGNQLAEIELNEIIFRKEVTDKLEKLAKDGSDEAAIEAGKLLTKEIFENTDDRTGLIQQVISAKNGAVLKYLSGGMPVGPVVTSASNVIALLDTLAKENANAASWYQFINGVKSAIDSGLKTHETAHALKLQEKELRQNVLDEHMKKLKELELELILKQRATELEEAYNNARRERVFQLRLQYSGNPLFSNKL